MTQQKLRNCCLVVAESIKNLISGAEALKSEAVKVRERADSVSEGQSVSSADLVDVAQDAKLVKIWNENGCILIFFFKKKRQLWQLIMLKN